MKKEYIRHPRNQIALACAALVLFVAHPVRADERAELEQLHATTHSLIDMLVEGGVLTREKADKLIREAHAKAKAKNAGSASSSPWYAANQPSETGKDGKKVVRVPYVPEAVKQEIRNQIKSEVLAQAKNERWGDPGTLPGWLDRISFDGDLRLRYEMTRLDGSNTPGGEAYTDGVYTRAADIVGNTLLGEPSLFNTQSDSSRLRVRARLGANVQLTDMVSGGIGFSTGNLTNRVSTNQTLGQNFNRYSVVIDRAFLKLDPAPWLSLSGGRFRNPFFSTDLVWAEDLGFEGAAVSFKPAWKWNDNIAPFFNAGYFPLREKTAGRASSRSLVGVQGGFDMKFAESKNKLKFGAALYDYHNLQGKYEDDEAFFNGDPGYVVRSEYPAGFRQRGNTLFITSAPSDPNIYWGLASAFRELNLTVSYDFARFDPFHIVFIGDYVKNLEFDRGEIERRTGFRLQDGKDHGWLAKMQFGHLNIAKRGDWNASVAYRYLGSDAVLDAFTSSDFGLGGTNSKGMILGLNYGIDNNTWIGARWMSSDVIDSMAGKRPDSDPQTKLATDILQIDLNARF